MSLKNIYLFICLITCIGLASANFRGWVIWNSIFPASYVHTEPGSHHK